MPPATTTSSREYATDPGTGKRYVKTQTVEGARVTVTKYVVGDPEKFTWSAATYSVTTAEGKTLSAALTWNGKNFVVKGKNAPTLKAAVRAVLGLEALPAPARKDPPKPRTSARKPRGGREKTGHPRADRIAADTGKSVIVTDPDTGMPSIDPEVMAKAEQVQAAALAKKAESEAAK